MWDYDSLFRKCQLYIRKALEHQDPESDEVALFSFIALEFLGRAVLSSVNKALLADPKDGYNVLHACGFGAKQAPKSIPTKTVFHRCTVVCTHFSQEDYKKCMEWMNHRNEELHTGQNPFSGMPQSSWMPEYFRIVEVLVQETESSLENLVGPPNLESVRNFIAASSREAHKAAFALVQKSKSAFAELTPAVRLERIVKAEDIAEKLKLAASLRIVDCPACEGKARINGDLIRSTTPQDDDGELVQKDVRLPTVLKCLACDLVLRGYPQLHAVGLGEQYTVKDYLDVAEYYGIEFDAERFYTDDSHYMNE